MFPEYEGFLVLPVDGGLPDWGQTRLYKAEDRDEAIAYAKELLSNRDIPVPEDVDEDDWYKGVDVNTHSEEIGESKDCVHIIFFTPSSAWRWWVPADWPKEE